MFTNNVENDIDLSTVLCLVVTRITAIQAYLANPKFICCPKNHVNPSSYGLQGRDFWLWNKPCVITSLDNTAHGWLEIGNCTSSYARRNCNTYGT